MELELEQLIEKYNLIEKAYEDLYICLNDDPDFYHEIYDGYDKEKFEYILYQADYEISHEFYDDNDNEMTFVNVMILIQYDKKPLYKYSFKYTLQGEFFDDYFYLV